MFQRKFFRLNMFVNALFTSDVIFKHGCMPGCVIYAVYGTRINLVQNNIYMHYLVWCQCSSPSEEKGFPAFGEQTAFALSSVQEEFFVNFGFVLRLQLLPLSFVAMFSQIFCFQPFVNKCRCIAKLTHTSSKHVVSYKSSNFGSYGHSRPLLMSAILNVFRLIMIETTS